MGNIIALSMLNIKRNKHKFKIYTLLIIIFIVLISNLINIDITLDVCIKNITLSKNYESIDYEMLASIKNIISMIIFFIMIITFIFINILITESIEDRFYEIAIYKSIGYKDKQIFILFFCELSIATIISYVLSIIPLFLSINIVKILLIQLNLDNKSINIIYILMIPLIVIQVIIFICSCKVLKKLKRLSINDLFKSI